jgi:hypothetical protein
MDFVKELARAAWRSLLWSVRTYAQTFSIMIGLFYYWASYHVPHGHLLNWHEFRAVLTDTLNALMQRISTGGCQ